jgi:hypothetical protein
MLEVGICGTDREICTFHYGTPPAGSDHLVIGHESLGEVEEIGAEVSRLQPGDLVVTMVRRPCPHDHCIPCRSGRKAPVQVDTDLIMRNLALKNQVVFGTVNAGTEVYEGAIRDLSQFMERWPDAVRSLFDGAAAAIRCGCAIRDAVRGLGMAVRVGIHAGEVEYADGTLGGITVNTASRITGMAQPGEVLVSNPVKELVAGSGITFTDRGTHILRGLPGEWQLFAPDLPEASACTS